MNDTTPLIEVSDDFDRLRPDSEIDHDAEYWDGKPGYVWMTNSDGEQSFQVTVAEFEAVCK